MKIAALVVTLAGAAMAQTFSVSGVVHNAVTGSPMGRVRVTISPETPNAKPVSMITSGDGAFQFSEPKGKYHLWADYREQRQNYGQGGPGVGFGVSIYTGPDQDTTNLNFRWFPPGAISGRVMDDRGEPAEGMLVQLIRSSVTGGRKRLITSAWEYTNDLGEYRFGAQAGGTYYLAVKGAPWYSKTMGALSAIMRAGQAGNGAPPATEVADPLSGYAPVYYPNALDLSGASPLKLSPGGEVRADFELKTVTGVDVDVRIAEGVKVPAGAMLSLLSDTVEGVEGFQSQAAMIGNFQSIPGVPPGHYVVRIAARGDNAFLAWKSIDVGATNVSVELTPQVPPSVSGKVSFTNPQAKRRGTLQVYLTDPNGRTVVQQVAADGTFHFTGLTPGNRRIRLAGTGGYFIAEASADGGVCATACSISRRGRRFS